MNNFNWISDVCGGAIAISPRIEQKADVIISQLRLPVGVFLNMSIFGAVFIMG